MRLLVVLGTSLLVVAATYSKEKATKKQLALLKGTWKVTKVEAPDRIAETLAGVSVWKFRGDKMIVTFTLTGDKKEVSEATIKLDPDKKPKHFDVTPLDGPNKGKAQKGIYELDGDVLKICYEGNKRPTDFTFKKGGAREVYTLKRVKK